MAFDKTPTTWLANWSEDDTNITVPIATFPELTAAEADATDGDIRKIVFAIVEKLWSMYNATAVADRPVKWTMTKSASVDAVRNVLKHQYVFKIETEIGTQELADETSSSPTATATSTSSASATPTSTASSTTTASISTSKSTSATATQTVTSTGSGTKTNSPTGTSTRTATDTSTSTQTQTPTASSSSTSTASPTSSSTATATATI